MKHNKFLIIGVFLLIINMVGCNKKQSNGYLTEQSTEEVITIDEATTEEIVQQKEKKPFAVNEKIDFVFHEENESQISHEEYENIKEIFNVCCLDETIDVPIYEYYDEDGDVCLNLYYDDKEGIGLVWFDKSVYQSDDAQCYIFYKSEIEEYSSPTVFYPYEINNEGNYLEPALENVNVLTHHYNSASPSYLCITDEEESDRLIARMEYLYYTDIEDELKSVKFNGDHTVFGNIASEFEIWYENNELTVYDYIYIGDVKYQTYNVKEKNRYEFYGNIENKKISIIIFDDNATITGL